MSNTNILFIDHVRKKKKSFWHYFLGFDYYTDDHISFKEKAYTFLYNMYKTGLTTQGEMDWSMRMMKVDYDTWSKMESEFKKDYIEFINNK